MKQKILRYLSFGSLAAVVVMMMAATVIDDRIYHHPLFIALQKADVNAMTPMDALRLVSEWKELWGNAPGER